jgi:very-short-patch-repair endonuclease
MRERAQQLRHGSTEAEERRWERLRSRQAAGLKFHRQHPIERCIVDFSCAERRLVIELDRLIHDAQTEHDAERTAWLEQRGYRVVRFTNDDVTRDIQAVLRQILVLCTE